MGTPHGLAYAKPGARGCAGRLSLESELSLQEPQNVGAADQSQKMWDGTLVSLIIKNKILTNQD